MVEKVEIRPLREEDFEGAYNVATNAFAENREEILQRSEEEVRYRISRYGHFLRNDPEGGWVADDDGEVVGVSLAQRREELWILSLFAVAKEHRGSGVGGALMKRALAYGEGCENGMIASSTHPAAMRSYANAGFTLHPSFGAEGEPDRGRLPRDLGVREGERQDLELAAAVDRELRGASHGPDFEEMLKVGRLLVCERGSGRGYAIVHEGSPWIVGATTEEVASKLLWASIEGVEGGKKVFVSWLTARQDWAVRVALAAGLELKPEGPICVRGEPGPLAPYLPSGPYL